MFAEYSSNYSQEIFLFILINIDLNKYSQEKILKVSENKNVHGSVSRPSLIFFVDVKKISLHVLTKIPTSNNDDDISYFC